MERETWTVEEAGRLLGISRASAYGAARRGELPVIRVGRRYLIPKVQLAHLLAGQQLAAAVETSSGDQERHDGDGTAHLRL
jgi:excisionase family DNA binding protein